MEDLSGINSKKQLKPFPLFPTELIVWIWNTSFANILLKYLKDWKLTWIDGAIFLVISGWQTLLQMNQLNCSAERQIGSLEFHTMGTALESVPTIKYHHGFEPAAPHQGTDLLLASSHPVETMTLFSVEPRAAWHLPGVPEHAEKCN